MEAMTYYDEIKRCCNELEQLIISHNNTLTDDNYIDYAQIPYNEELKAEFTDNLGFCSFDFISFLAQNSTKNIQKVYNENYDQFVWSIL